MIPTPTQDSLRLCIERNHSPFSIAGLSTAVPDWLLPSNLYLVFFVSPI